MTGNLNPRGMKILRHEILDGMKVIISRLSQDQSQDGSWNYPFETGISTDCYMIILLRSLGIDDENLIMQLTERILSKQEKNGAWKLYADEKDGNLSSTVEAYYALLYSGNYDKKDKRIIAAKEFILVSGGLEKAHMFTKIMLAITGQMKWPRYFPIPIELILLPPTFPINFYHFSEFGRANLTPIFVLADQKFQLKTKKSPNLSDLYTRLEDSYFYTEEIRSLYSFFQKAIKNLIGLPEQLHRQATEQAKQYMISRLEPDGTFLGYFSSTFLMIFALLSLGYPKNHPIITHALNGLKSMKCEIKGLPHMQYTTANVWNTSLITYALQEAGVSPQEPIVKKSNQYLLSRQHYKYGDWVVHNPSGFPGGWGFQDINTIHPDVDDTTASLRAIARSVQNSTIYRHSWERGILWVLSMQNADGGWPAFERNTNSKVLSMLPVEKAEFILSDPSSADLTGRTLEFLGAYTNLLRTHPSIRAGVNWLYQDQKKDGSWYGRWGICYIYGTWASVTGLRAVGVSSTHSSIMKAVTWLGQIQNKDGGWGESCRSDLENTYIPLGASTLTHTAWALDALIATSDKPTKEIDAGMNFLLENLDNNDWKTEYPKGQGMAGGFYIHYHSYRYVFPLLALAHFNNKYSS